MRGATPAGSRRSWRNGHQHARTNPRRRALPVRRFVEGGWTAASTAAAFGISLRTVRNGLARHRAEGPAGRLGRPARHREPARAERGTGRE
ncbi:MAG: leucine zipper domain-containing protein [Geminicoccaceae bacterium]